MADDLDRIECTDLRLRQLGRLVSRHYDDRLRPVGLKNSQYALLSYLEATGPLQLRLLAARMRLDASTLTRNLQLPVSAGWIKVVQGTDGRSRVALITPSGLDKVQSARPVWAEAQRALTATLGPEVASALKRSLDNSLRSLESARTVGGASRVVAAGT